MTATQPTGQARTQKHFAPFLFAHIPTYTEREKETTTKQAKKISLKQAIKRAIKRAGVTETN